MFAVWLGSTYIFARHRRAALFPNKIDLSQSQRSVQPDASQCEHGVDVCVQFTMKGVNRIVSTHQTERIYGFFVLLLAFTDDYSFATQRSSVVVGVFGVGKQAKKKGDGVVKTSSEDERQGESVGDPLS